MRLTGETGKRNKRPEIPGLSWRLLIWTGLRLGDFAALDAVGADADALCRSVDERMDGLKIRAPTAPGYVVGVRDVIAKLRAFAANVAYLCHC